MKIMTLWAFPPGEILLPAKGQEVRGETVTSDEGRLKAFVLTSALVLCVCVCVFVSTILSIDPRERFLESEDILT